MLEARDVGTAIRNLRGERSRDSLAREAGLDPMTLAGYERGNQMPPADVLARLAEALGISEPELDLRIIDRWRHRVGEELPQSLEGKRLELFEHIQVLGLRLSSMVETLDDMAFLQGYPRDE